MAPVDPAPLTWTIRLKLHKSTVLLIADPLAPISHIKTELLRALHARCPGGSIQTASGPTRIPQSENDVLLAKPVDINKASEGWRRMMIAGEDDANGDDGGMDGASDSKAKGRKKSTTTNGDAAAVETPKHAGLKDGSVLAFRFRGHRRKAEGLGLDVDEEGAEWDVVLPSYEDFTGTANTGDVGGG